MRRHVEDAETADPSVCSIGQLACPPNAVEFRPRCGETMNTGPAS